MPGLRLFLPLGYTRRPGLHTRKTLRYALGIQKLGLPQGFEHRPIIESAGETLYASDQNQKTVKGENLN